MQRIQKTIGELFPPDRTLPSVTPEDSVAVALELMRSRGCDAVVVQNDGNLAGIFTERDFLNRVAAQKRDASTTVMRDVMTAEPRVLATTDCVTYAINLMAVRGFRNIPIVENGGKIVEVLTVRDVVAHLWEVFSELEEDEREGWDEWLDIGGGA